jgi:hypothetical protein
MPTPPEPVIYSPSKPHPASHDSSAEHSLDHWLEVYWLVEEEYLFAKDVDPEPHVVATHGHERPAKNGARHRKSAPHR